MDLHQYLAVPTLFELFEILVEYPEISLGCGGFRIKSLLMRSVNLLGVYRYLLSFIIDYKIKFINSIKIEM